ncbi:hypothetical protein J6590_058680 [Homalodisca vitripennis]|nr:hypothetical protein J6590_058680 [Homalodisca vitripennis]
MALIHFPGNKLFRELQAALLNIGPGSNRSGNYGSSALSASQAHRQRQGFKGVILETSFLVTRSRELPKITKEKVFPCVRVFHVSKLGRRPNLLCGLTRITGYSWSKYCCCRGEAAAPLRLRAKSRWIMLQSVGRPEHVAHYKRQDTGQEVFVLFIVPLTETCLCKGE